jgi:hypothetical protein
MIPDVKDNSKYSLNFLLFVSTKLQILLLTLLLEGTVSKFSVHPVTVEG